MPLVHRIPSNLDLLQLHQFDPETYPFLLETALPSSGDRHFDILFAFPEKTLSLQSGNNLTFDGSLVSKHNSDFLANFDLWWKKDRQPEPGVDGLPFAGGWFVYLGYELAGQIEPSLRLPANKQCEPMAFATRIPAAFIQDHLNKTLYAVAENGRQDLLDAMLSHVRDIQSNSHQQPTFTAEQNIKEENPERYLAGVEKIKTYIKDGDVFQVNLSRGWQVHFSQSPPTSWLYRRLRRHNPSPFFGLAKFANGAIISSSPERLVSVRQGTISTRPIAGTRPRGVGEQGDNDMLDELIGHPKERAEHIMLVDLERNDLGRICTPGSIKVNELMVLETYAHVHHIVSNITGSLRQDVTPGQVIRALFPGGTITGCPKVRCMEIIAELEATGRGAYTGSMGYITHNGDMDFNILIRSMVLCHNNDDSNDETNDDSYLHFRAGAGIVADSIAEKELAETRAKAKGLLNALDDSGPTSG